MRIGKPGAVDGQAHQGKGQDEPGKIHGKNRSVVSVEEGLVSRNWRRDQPPGRVPQPEELEEDALGEEERSRILSREDVQPRTIFTNSRPFSKSLTFARVVVAIL